MQTDGGDTARAAQALELALDEALAELPAGDRGAAPEDVDYHWLRVGMWLGLERPESARHLLDLIGALDSDLAAQRAVGAGDAAPAGGRGDGGPEGSGQVPLLSSLLVRSAAMSGPDRADAGPEVTFGWAGRLTRGQILTLGRTALEMLAAGDPPDIGRGFGLAWDGGVRIPRHELDAMFREFTELELTAASVLVGRDLRTGGSAPRPASRPQGLGGLLGQLVPRGRPEESEAAAAIEASGEPGRKGLVALWNVWVANRYRTLIPQATFELLVHPWVTVVGPLPEA